MKSALGHPGGMFFQPEASLPLSPHCPLCQVCSLKLSCFPDHLPHLPVPSPGSSVLLFGLVPTLPTPTPASFSCHFLHDSWATIFRTDLMVSVCSLQSCAFRTWLTPSPSVMCRAAVTPRSTHTALPLLPGRDLTPRASGPVDTFSMEPESSTDCRFYPQRF